MNEEALAHWEAVVPNKKKIYTECRNVTCHDLPVVQRRMSRDFCVTLYIT